MRWSAETLAAACDGRLVRRGVRPIASAFIDSREPRSNGLFVPIVAARDGHDFIPQAIQAGAAAVLTQPGRSLPPGDCTVVEVDDTLEALTRLARDARATKGGPAVAITGSNGKTTTRAMIQAVLEASFDPVLCTQGNLNNHLGVPLTLLDEPHDPAAMVLELGMSAPGENDHLASIVRPTVGVITSIALEHLEFMKTIEAIADAEFEVASHLEDDGMLVIPVDEPLLAERIPTDFRPRVVRVGPLDQADVAIVAVVVAADDRGRTQVELRLPGGERLEVWLNTFGAHNARNAASAVAVGLALGVPTDRMAEALSRVEPVGDRGRVKRFGEHLLVADCYNANPGSMEAALASFGALRLHRPGKLVAVLGDMLELGPSERDLHLGVGRFAAGQGLDAVIGFGRLGESIVAGARAAGLDAEFVGDDVDAAVAAVEHRLGTEPGGVLLKASRGMALERVAARLVDHGDAL